MLISLRPWFQRAVRATYRSRDDGGRGNRVKQRVWIFPGCDPPEEHARRQQVGAARQVVLHVQVVVAEFGADQLGRGEYAHPAGVRRARVARRPSDQLLARVEVRRAVGRALAEPPAHRLRVAGHVRAVTPDAQIPRAPRPLFAVPSAAQVQPANNRPLPRITTVTHHPWTALRLKAHRPIPGT